MVAVFIILISFFVPEVLLGQTSTEAGASVGLKQILESAEQSAPALLLERLEAKALRSKGMSGVGRALPELGVEVGARSNREFEKRTDSFYYAYARYELSLAEIAALKAGLARKDLGDLSLRLAKARAMRELAIEFFRALSIQKQIELKEGDFSFAEKQIAAARKRVEAGLATESDILEFQMHQNALRNELRTLKLDLELKFQDLARLCGLSTKIYSLIYEVKDFSSPIELDSALIEAMRSSLELAKVSAELRIAESEKLAAWGEFLPKLSAEALYGKMQETDFVESRKNSWAVVGKVTIPVFNGGASTYRVGEASAVSERAHLLLSLETARIRDKVNSLVSRQNELSDSLKAEQENLKATQKYFDLVMSEYRRGVKNSPDVASATDKLFEAKWRVFETWRDLTLAVIDLNLIQGKELKL